MTPRERLIAVVEGKSVEAKPEIGWPNQDVADGLTYAEIDNPFGKAMRQNVSLPGLLRRDLKEGEKKLAEMAEAVKQDFVNAITKGADVIVYKLYGADFVHSTPMEYGGHFLEVDRTILTQSDANMILVFVVGGAEAFIDFVSDLPAQIFAWDVVGTGVTVAQVRQMRKGTLAAASPDADITLTHQGDISPVLHIEQLTNV
jgi:hypothetical protein